MNRNVIDERLLLIQSTVDILERILNYVYFQQIWKLWALEFKLLVPDQCAYYKNV